MNQGRLFITLNNFLLILLFFYLSPTLVEAGALPDTGQAKCYNNNVEIACPATGQPFYGQDAQYQGPTRSYTKLGENGTVLPGTATYADGWLMTRDNVTGLVWEMKTDDNSIHKKDKTFTYCDKNTTTNGGNQGDCGTGTGAAATDTEAFIKALNDSNYGGFSDWRLPTVSQLSYLINSSIPLPGPAIATDWFPNTIYWPGYWSFAAFDYPTLLAWRVSFAYGNVYDAYRTEFYHVRAVRGESAVTALTDNGDATVTDTANRLMWQKTTAPGTYTWQEALSYCENLNLANHTDWRLPNRNELQSLVVYSRWNPPVDPLLVADTISSYYWSSTTYASDTSWAWYVSFYFPQIYAISKTDSHRVRCVRGLPGTIRQRKPELPWLQFLLED